MALTADQIRLLRAELGTAEPPTDADLTSLHDLRGGLVGVIRHVWRERLAAFLATPGVMGIPGEYNQATTANIEAIRNRLAELAGIPDDSDEIPPGGGVLAMRVVPLVRVGQDR